MKVKICREAGNYFVEIPLEIIQEIDIDENGRCKCVMKTGKNSEIFDCQIIQE